MTAASRRDARLEDYAEIRAQELPRFPSVRAFIPVAARRLGVSTRQIERYEAALKARGSAA